VRDSEPRTEQTRDRFKENETEPERKMKNKHNTIWQWFRVSIAKMKRWCAAEKIHGVSIDFRVSAIESACKCKWIWVRKERVRVLLSRYAFQQYWIKTIKTKFQCNYKDTTVLLFPFGYTKNWSGIPCL
jgi:hypothetical protein